MAQDKMPLHIYINYLYIYMYIWKNSMIEI